MRIEIALSQSNDRGHIWVTESTSIGQLVIQGNAFDLISMLLLAVLLCECLGDQITAGLVCCRELQAHGPYNCVPCHNVPVVVKTNEHIYHSVYVSLTLYIL